MIDLGNALKRPCTHEGGQKRPHFETVAVNPKIGPFLAESVPKLIINGTIFFARKIRAL